MIGNHAHRIAGGIVPVLRQPQSDIKMPFGPVGFGEHAVGHVAHHVAAECPDICLAGEDVLVDQPLERGSVALGAGVGIRGRRHLQQLAGRAAAAEHRCGVHQPPLGRAQRVETGGNQPAQRVGHLRQRPFLVIGARTGTHHARLTQQHAHLLEEERVAAAALVELIGQVGGSAAAQQLGGQLGGGLATQRIQVQHHRAVTARRYRPALLVHVPAGRGDHHERLVGQCCQQLLEHAEQPLFGPVHIAQQQDDGLATRHRSQEAAQGAESGLGPPLDLGGIAAAHPAQHGEHHIGDLIDLLVVDDLALAVAVGGPQHVGHQRRDTPRGLHGRVAGLDSCCRRDGIAQAAQRVGLVVGQRHALEHHRVVALGGAMRGLTGEARLAHARLAHDLAQPCPPAGHRGVDRGLQQGMFEIAPHQRRDRGAAVAAGRRQLAAGHEDRHGLVTPAQADLAPGRVVHNGSRGRLRRRAHQHLAGFGERLQPARDVHRVAHGRVVAARPQRPHQHLAGVDADADAQVEIALGVESLQRALHAERGPQRPLRVVFVRRGRAEQRQDRVADDLVDRAPERRHVGHEPLEALVDQMLDLFGVGGLAHRGEPDQVGEQHRDDAALLGRDEQVAAGMAEACALRDLSGARRTLHRGILETTPQSG